MSDRRASDQIAKVFSLGFDLMTCPVMFRGSDLSDMSWHGERIRHGDVS